MALLSVKDLKVNYGGIEALKGISFDVPEGKIVTLIGANGAGKSTTLKAISGIVKAAEGSISYADEDITGLDAQKIVSRGIVLVPEGRRVFPNLSVLENLKIGAYLRKDKAGIDADVERVYDMFPRLKERHWQMAGTLSGGEQQMLAVGRALMAKPKLIMMDEPSLGLAPLLVRSLFEPGRTINERGVTVLIVEQNARAALKLATRGYVLEVGNMVKEGRADELLADPSVREAYLGG